MFRTKILASVFGATLFALASGTALAHESDVHHWFEHQRALTDGGTVGLVEAEARAPSGNGNGGRAALPGTKRSVAATAPDCFIEQLQMSEGFVPSGACTNDPARTLANERWIVDEDKQQGRHAQGAPAR